jgi:hypothetical protein
VPQRHSTLLRAAMADEARCALYCLVDGEHKVFEVMVSVSNDMKKFVYQEGISEKYRTRSKRLILWKMSILPMSVPMLQSSPL